MPAPYTIVLPLLMLGGLGLGYAVYSGFDQDRDQPSNEAALDLSAEQPDQASLPPDVGRPPTAAGSSARRMDDFGAGPSGTAVTVPLRNRHRQAFGAQTGGGGGAPAAEQPEKADDPAIETAAVSPADSDDGSTMPTPAFRVIERPAETGEQPAAAASGAAATPSFDVVRVDPKGNAVLAGRAMPFAEVEVKVGDEVIDRVTATAQGEWVSIPSEPLASGDQELSLTASGADAKPVASRQVVVVSIPEANEELAAAEASEPMAVILDKEKGGEGRILQAPDKLQGEGQLALKLVDYDDEGAIKLSGEAPPGVPVRIYIDNEPAALVIGDSKGYWITTLDQDLPGGDYTLRLDQLDAKGQTIARLETPLTRVTTPPVAGESKVDYVVVQPGNSLWRIARRLSGDGFNYLYIFEANQAQIRDPDVIYPGQVFEVPSDVGVAG